MRLVKIVHPEVGDATVPESTARVLMDKKGSQWRLAIDSPRKTVDKPEPVVYRSFPPESADSSES